MAQQQGTTWKRKFGHKFNSTYHPALLGSVPAVCLLLYWLVGEIALIACAVVFPLLALVLGNRRERPYVFEAGDTTNTLMQRDAYEKAVEAYFNKSRNNGLRSACFVLEIDEFDEFSDRFGQQAADDVVATTGQRLFSCMRAGDAISQTGDSRFSICLAPVKQLDLELCLQVSARIQSAVEEPVAIDGTGAFVSASVGFCQAAKMLEQDSRSWSNAAAFALRQAQANGPKSIRAYSDEMRRRSQTRAELREEVVAALENGQICAWFQPQISTDTGLVSGFEALARWEHPKHGMIPPASFLSAIDQAGMLERLAELMMLQSFTALKAWDNAGVDVPQVGVNFAGPELNNPKLVDKVKWELDRFVCHGGSSITRVESTRSGRKVHRN